MSFDDNRRRGVEAPTARGTRRRMFKDRYPVMVACPLSVETADRLDEYTERRYPNVSRASAVREMIESILAADDPETVTLTGHGYAVVIKKVEDNGNEHDQD